MTRLKLRNNAILVTTSGSPPVAKLAVKFDCCCGFSCVNVGEPDQCGNYTQACQKTPGGNLFNCAEPCPEPPPCLLQCVEIGETPCGDPVYDCPVYSTESIGIVVESCDECPDPPPCDEYYCCYGFEPSQNPESPLPPRNCQIGPCSAPELYSSGPHPTLVQCAAACENWYCCYTEQPSQNPEMPLPPSACQLGPCDSIELQRSGPHYTLQACQNACKTYYCCYIEQPSENPEIPLPPSLCQVGPCAAIELQKSGPHQTLAECEQDCPPECVYACYCHPGAGGAGWVVQDTPCSTSGQNCCTYGAGAGCNTIVATTTINKPPAFAGVVVRVTITGSADDDIAIDGVFAGPPCRAAGAVNHAFTMAANDPSFDLGVVDSFGFCVGAELTICFVPLCDVRTQPTVTVVGTSGSGSGATFGVTLSQSQDAAGLDVWPVSAVTITGGTGYKSGDTLTFAVAEGDTEELSATAVVNTARTAPNLTLEGSATATIATTHNNDNTWSIASVSVTSAGGGYTNGATINVLLNGATQVSPATLIANTIRVAPTVELQVFPGAGYAFGASLTPTFSETTDENGDPAWVISSIAIESGGTDYWVGDLVVFPNVAVVGEVETVDEVRRAFGIPIGPITGITIYPNVLLWSEGLGSVSVQDGGVFFGDSGIPVSVAVANGGRYYRCEENPFP